LSPGSRAERIFLWHQQWHRLSRGGLNKNESIKDGALREFKEETGLTVNIDDIKPSRYKTGDSLYYIFEKLIDQPIPVNYENVEDKGEIKDIKWFDISKIKKSSLNNLTKQLLY
jgi:8-oxo-dGTP pyrophosphatase MutT (NUDIX family)